jgi:uncharacterized membrane protein YjfL (UPF0719 family)
MSGDEIFALLLGGGLALWTWMGWYLSTASVSRLGARSPGKTLMSWWPVACAAALFAVLKTSASFDVRDDVAYLTLYMVIGAGWVGVILKLLPITGISPRDDILERGNGAAVPAVAGALLGFTLCFAGGNIGDGPGWTVVIYSASIATFTLAVSWLAFDRLTRVSDTITIERDAAAGVRLGGLLVGAALILGRAVAGDWVSGVATWRDFVVHGWPALLLFIVAVPFERGLLPTQDHPSRSVAAAGAAPALLYLAAAIAYVVYLGPA